MVFPSAKRETPYLLRTGLFHVFYGCNSSSFPFFFIKTRVSLLFLFKLEAFYFHFIFMCPSGLDQKLSPFLSHFSFLILPCGLHYFCHISLHFYTSFTILFAILFQPQIQNIVWWNKRRKLRDINLYLLIYTQIN